VIVSQLLATELIDYDSLLITQYLDPL